MHTNPLSHFLEPFSFLLIITCLSVGCKNDAPAISSIHAKTPTIDKVKKEVVSTPELEEKDTLTTIENQEEVAEVVTKKEVIKKPAISPSKPKPKKKRPRPRPAIKFELDRYDFGEINQGDTVDVDFKFANVGKGPLVINTVKVTCGCTQPSYPFVPIDPGEEGTIGIKYVSVGKEGAQKPLVTVYTNASKEPITLMLSGIVNVPEKDEEIKDTLAPEEAPVDSLQNK